MNADTPSLFEEEQIETSEISWFGQQVSVHKGSVGVLRELLPKFTREEFQFGAGSNAYLDQIVRQPLNGEGVMPVATVSKQYVLVQHTDVFDSLLGALKGLEFNMNALPAQLRLSEYGERMHLQLLLVNDSFDPGDGNLMGVRVDCINSVDRSTSLEISLNWHRLVCDNGMSTSESSKVKRTHLGSLQAGDVSEYLNEQLKKMNSDESWLSKWFSTPVGLPAIEEWADKTLAAKWGDHLAARTCSISRTGYDGEILNPFYRCRPHERTVSTIREVPGACAPVNNLFHLSQVLSWLAKERRTVQDQFAKMLEIPELISPFINA